jgi:hypothetical protein
MEAVKPQGVRIADIPAKTSQTARNSPVAPAVAIPVKEREIPSKPDLGGEPGRKREWKPRRGHPRLKNSGDVVGLACRIVKSLLEYGGHWNPVPKTVLYRALHGDRYELTWEQAFSLLKKSKVIEETKDGIRLLQPTWGQETKAKKRRRRRPQTEWFREHRAEFNERDGLGNDESDED